MTELGVVRRKVKRAERAAVEALGRYGVATVHEAMGRVGLMKPYMRPIYPGALISGTAVTVLLHPGDNWMMHVAAEQIQPGDVVVAISASSNSQCILRALEYGASIGCRTVALTGSDGGKVSTLADITIHVESTQADT